MNKKQQFATLGARGGAQGAMAFRRGPAGNHVELRTRDKWEQQADEAARRILRGERNVARLLTPTRAASYPEHASAGRPLPSRLREDFETAFGADLSAVRIHSDAASSAAARNEYALAFTSGRDIYFAASRFDASAPGGRRLLAHEIAHVLQQTARSGSEGRLRATEAAGVGDIQREDLFSQIRKLHEPKDWGLVSDYNNLADKLGEAYNSNDEKGFAVGFIRTANIKKLPEESESLLYDTLKLLGKYEEAAALLGRNDFAGGARIRTAYSSPQLIEALEARNSLGVYGKAFKKHPMLKAYWQEFLRLHEVFIFQPLGTDPVVPLLRPGSSEKIEDHLARLAKNLLDITDLSENEWVYGALAIMANLEKLRVNDLRVLQQKIDRLNFTTPIFQKRFRAEGIKEMGQWYRNFKFTTPDGKHNEPAEQLLGEAYRDLSASLEDIGNAAIDQWDRAVEMQSARVAFLKSAKAEKQEDVDPIKEAQSIVTIGSNLKVNKLFLDVINKWKAAGKTGDRPPAADEFAGRALALAEQIEKFSREKLEARQAALFHQQKTDDEIAVIWLILFLAVTADGLRNAAAKGTKDKLGVESLDFRVSSTLRIAYSVYLVADAVGWADVVKVCEDVLEAREVKESQLALLEDWAPQKGGVENMREDFGTAPLIGYGPLNADTLVLFYQARYYETLTANLIASLPRNSAAEQLWVDRAAKDTPYLLSQAIARVNNNLKMPVRYVVEAGKFDIALKEGDKNLVKVLLRHPKTAALVEAQKKAGLHELLPLELSRELFIWFLPALDDLVKFIRNLDPVRMAITAVVPDEKNLSNNDWLMAVSKYLVPMYYGNAAITPEATAIMEAVSRVLRQRREAAWSALEPKTQDALRVDRELLARHIRIGLNRFGRDDIRNYGVPNDVIAAMRDFSAAVAPDTDRTLAMTALVLEISTEFPDAFKYTSRYDVITGLLGYLEQAQEVIAKQEPELLRAKPAALLPEGERNDAWIRIRLGYINDTVAHFHAVRAKVQARFGFKAFASENHLESMVYGIEVKPGMEMVGNSGGRYKVLEIKRDFTFHPSYGEPALDKDSAPTAYAPPELLDLDGEKKLEVSPDDVLLVIELAGVQRSLSFKPADIPTLTDLSSAIEKKSFQISMKNLEYLIRKYMDTLMDAVELIPGVGLAVTATRIVETIAEFYAEGGYDAVKDLIKGQIQEYLRRLWQEVKDAADAEHMWTLLLFGDERLDAVLSKLEQWGAGAEGGRKKSTGSGKFKAVRAAINAFKKLGHALFKAWEKIHDWIQIPMDDFRTYCSTRPILSFVFNFIADNITTILSWGEKMLALAFGEKSDTVSDDFKKMLGDQQKGVAERVQSMLVKLEKFKLPGTIIHMEPIYQFVMDELILFIVGRLGAKGKAVKLVLKETGALDLFTARLAAELVSEGVDPNVYWRNEVVPLVTDKFNKARESLVKDLRTMLQADMFGTMFDNITTPNAMTGIDLTAPEFEETKYEETPETETQASSTNAPASPPAVPPVGAGQPLDAHIRTAAEKRFGHDFSHVRIHTFADAEAMTRMFRADALTTGSHIFMRPGLRPDQGRGRRVFDHELAHVLQQAGPRPLGTPADERPVVGRPGRGLNLDAVREAAADRVAELVGGRKLGAPVDVYAAPEEGLQPVLDMNPFTIAKILRTVSSPDVIKKRQAEIEEIIRRPGHAKPKLPPNVEAGVKLVLDALKSGSKTMPAKVFKKEMTAIATQLSNGMEDIEKAAYQIAFEAMEEAETKGAAADPAKKKEEIRLFNPRHFARELEGFVLGRTGIVIGLDLKTKTEDLGGHKNPLIEEVKEIKILHVHLPFVLDGRSYLWIDVLTNTWPEADENQRTKLREAAREYLTNKITATVFALFSDTYKFGYFTEKGIRDYVKTAGGGALPASELPVWRDYIETDPSKAKKHPQHGHIGLRLATYGHASQTGTGRESHHLTQYLLADYFANQNDTKAFDPKFRWPGVKRSSKGVDSFQAPGHPDIQIAKTRGSDRGELMPAILLAASTHRGGSLHITPEPDDFDHKAKKTQAYAVHNEFNRNLPRQLRDDAKAGEHRDYLSHGTESEAQEEIYVAITRTYQTVRKHMADRLKAALPEYELAYYKALAEDNISRKLSSADETLFTASLNQIAKDAEQHNLKGRNNDGMESLGWKASL